MDNQDTPSPNRIQTAKNYITPLVFFIGLIWVLEFIDWLIFSNGLDQLGIIPREFVGLRGIVLSPFLHDGFDHVLANTAPFFILGLLVLLRNGRQFASITLTIIVVSGLGVWLLGAPNSIHIGASGIVFGYFGFLLSVAYYEKSVAAVLLAAIVVFLYGGMVQGLLPQQEVSWLGHIFGFVGGIVAARAIYRPQL